MRRKMTTVGLAVALGAALTIGWLWVGPKDSSTAAPLAMSRQHSGAVDSVSSANLLPDSFQLKYPPEQRARFHVSSSKPAAIFVRATGVQIRTDSGWKLYSEESRNEMWRLKPGTAQDLFVEIPRNHAEETWRAYILYWPEMHGLSLFKAQVREAWKIRSFTNWTGKAWGGGRFSGRYELFSEDFSE